MKTLQESLSIGTFNIFNEHLNNNNNNKQDDRNIFYNRWNRTKTSSNFIFQ